MYESTLLAEALSTKSEINSILEDRGFTCIDKFYKSETTDEKVKNLVRDLARKYKLNVEKIG